MLEDQIYPGDVLLGPNFTAGTIGAIDNGNRMSSEGLVHSKTVKILRTTKTKYLGGLLSWNKQKIIKSGEFKWLPYVENRINYIVAGGKDVLSGPFSGCILSHFNDGGSEKVAHVFCAKGDAGCEGKWATYTGQSGVTLKSEFKPHEWGKEQKSCEIYGLITNTGKNYAIALEKNYAPSIKNPLEDKEWDEIYKNKPLKLGETDTERASELAYMKNAKTVLANQAFGTCIRVTSIIEVPKSLKS